MASGSMQLEGGLTAVFRAPAKLCRVSLPAPSPRLTPANAGILTSAFLLPPFPLIDPLIPALFSRTA